MPSIEKKRLKKDFNRAASTYDNYALLQKNVAHNLFSMALDRLSRKITVLDAGAGTGFFSRFAAMHNMGLRVMALDIAWRMCELSSREPGTWVVNADMELLPLKNASIDAVFSSLALQWVGAPSTALAECCRVLKSDGKILLATIAEGTLLELEESFAAIGEPQRVGQFMNEKMLQGFMEDTGFKNIQIKSQPMVLHYPDVLTLLRSIKQIGAASKREDRNRGLLKRSSIARLEHYYHSRFAEDGWLKATWNILYINAEKR